MPLGPELVEVDYAAYMSSIDHLQATFTRSTRWPHADITAADAMQDMVNEEARFAKRESFAFAVLTSDGSRERGCIYVYPSSVEGYDAVVTLWVTKAEYDAGFDAQLYEWTQQWLAAEWPFESVAYPGRAIEWARWDARVALSHEAGTASQ
ncbi:twin-arginine translocation pathway signal protein [Qipengyuania flava]|nr:twin-arginine translocation pathway signal protein [Qipengyuania flava]MBW3169392.1 twin-arginine translocation pathway signal protein [Qipengyuania flava]MBY5966630.1 twin-arginine translocation pathway signal protein [Qipengyuania flava]MBY6012954.1 twin-arginine translocation pathway signal protein [Qipengyuania flava]MBY6027396.1 twin-arginine translocation pathway signal protein [Qipengyuania flava]